MTKLTCGHLTGYNAFCKNPIKETTARCAAGHPVSKKRMKATLHDQPLPDVMTVQFDVDDVFEVAGSEELVWNDITFHHAQNMKFDADGNPVPRPTTASSAAWGTRPAERWGWWSCDSLRSSQRRDPTGCVADPPKLNKTATPS